MKQISNKIPVPSVPDNLSVTENSENRFIEGFSALKMKQEVQEQIYRETKGMTDQEVREYFHKGSEQFRKKIKSLRNMK
ncbi:MAG: hypothetical protein LBF88_06515 [Planctomycetaceae bacterium]|jgi:hypothetical protein|nr:hypothetical protein [Planctomycetaceae bacterium]